jgi:hypothetical protein
MTSERYDDPRQSQPATRTYAVRRVAKLAVEIARKRKKSRGWAVGLLYHNVSDIATGEQCSRAIAKYWFSHKREKV